MGTVMTDWNPVLRGEFDEGYWKELRAFVAAERSQTVVYPPQEQEFAALRLTPYAQTKVLILGQDPYHGPGQAHGLCFSVTDGVKPPPSLVNIYKELEDDLGITPQQHGNLEHWARQGVLLLNNSLTVEEGRAGSHQMLGWEPITDAAVAAVADKEEPCVFMLWGSHARKKASRVPGLMNGKHLVLTAPHPSPLSAYSGFFGSKHFSKANQFLESQGRGAIDW